MKVFISWSGSVSKKVAETLHEWLPILLPGLDPWMSHQDIEFGSKWLIELFGQLEDTHFGLICLTADNLNSPWMLFEAGAVAKQTKESRVVPLLYGVKKDQLPSPYRYFQAAFMHQKGDFFELVKQLNNHLGEEARNGKELETLFESVWPKINKEVESGLAQLLTEHPEQAYQYYAERFGVGHADVQFLCDIHPDGTAQVQRFVTVEAFSELDSLDTILLYPEAFREDTEGELNLVQIVSFDDPMRIKYRAREYSHRLSVDLTFNPALQRGEQLRYLMTETATKPAFHLGNMKSETPVEEEFFGWHVNRPTRRLRLRIVLPPKEEPDKFWADVRRASLDGLPAARSEQTEVDRLQQPDKQVLSDGRHALSLSVDFPVNGFIYFVNWEPRHMS